MIIRRSNLYTSIEKVVATGKLNPEDEIELKPQVSGIIDNFVEEGDKVKRGDLIANIRVVPNEQALLSARSRINSAKLSYENSRKLYDRSENYLKRTSYPNRILKTVNCQWSNPENLLNRQKMILKSLNREL